MVGENVVVQGAHLLFVSGDSFLDGVVIGVSFAGKRGDAARAQIPSLTTLLVVPK
jgi:hypothetical protein